MVCEVPKGRQLLISRRGSFFEDPFFRDAWDDYSHAVRRIVDRFNRGWVSPSDRIRDSQYHSMYRTLRSARLNYSTHSARFKEEGNVYKLVMDVREFVGGDITVRTAGGTVSVRGRLDLGADEAGATKGKKDDNDNDDESTVSGTSTSSKTLHRRFTLPADADCEKVESSLSRDAVLTVKIPKRSDVHFIPVNIEGEGDTVESRVGGDATRRPGVKRPSDTPSEPNRKKSQDESSRSRRRHRREESRYREEERQARRSKDFDGHEPRSSKLEDKVGEDFDGKRRRRSEEKENDENSSKDRRYRRREGSKYENVQEINIPVRITRDEGVDKVFRPTSFHEPVVHNIEIEHEESGDLPDKKDRLAQKQESKTENQDEKKNNKNTEKHRKETERKKDSTRQKNYFSKAFEKATKDPIKLTSKYNETKKEKFQNKKSEEISGKNVLTENLRQMPDYIEEEKQIPKPKESPEKMVSVPLIDLNGSYVNGHIENDAPKEAEEKELKSKTSKKDLEEKIPQQISDSVKKTQKEDEKYKKDNKKPAKSSLETPRINTRPTSPVSPGSRIVKVEEDPNLMEEGIFKDCWSDFSNTLQDVLSRLQELSSELGQSKILAITTPSAETSPPLEEKVTKLGSDDCGVKRSSWPLSDLEASQGPWNKASPSSGEDIPAHYNVSTSGVGGTSGREGGAKDDWHSSHSPHRSGHGRSEAPAVGAALEHQKESETKNTFQPLTGLERKPNRPVTLPLRSVASPQDSPPARGASGGQPAPTSRPRSLFAGDTPPGSLLESLRKDSPVEALQESFLRRSKEKREPERVEEDRRRAGPGPVGGKELSLQRPLSPSSLSQSSAEADASESDDDDDEDEVSDTKSEEPRDLRQGKTAESDGGDPAGRVFTFDRIPLADCETSDTTLNDLGESNLFDKNLRKESPIKSKIAFEPNIDTSPESNLTDESGDSPDEGDERGKLFHPVSKRTPSEGTSQDQSQEKPRVKDVDKHDLRDVTSNCDVVNDANLFANERLPEIPSNDAMGCERPLAPRARVPLRSAKEDSSLRFSRINKPRDLLLQEERGDAESGRRASGAMGGVFSRGRKPPESPPLPSTPPSAKGVKSSSPTLPPDEAPVPPYIRKRTEPSKRYSGFAHVNSDNVRRMRDVWGSKQDPKPPQTPPRSHKVPPSPTRSTSRRSSDSQGRSSPLGESPRSRTLTPSERERFSPLTRTSPSPSRGIASSPSYAKPTTDRFFNERTPPSSPRITPKSPQKPNSPPYSSYGRRGSQGSQGRASPVPSSPCRRCSRGARESPAPSPSLERRQRYDYGGRRPSEEKPRSRTPSKGSPTLAKEPPTKKAPPPPSPAASSPTSRVHQKIFRRLRDASLQPDSSAICFKEEEDKYKMVLDVEEYVPGEVEVLQDDKVLTVKGEVQTKEKGGHVSLKSFFRTFNIPKNSREEDIDSALSKDGILTIYVPKKRERVIKIELVD